MWLLKLFKFLTKLLGQISFTYAFLCYPTAEFPLQRTAVKVSADHLKRQVKTTQSYKYITWTMPIILIIVHIFSQSDEEQDLVYAVPTIIRRKSVKSHDAETDESIYTDVREHWGEGLTGANLWFIYIRWDKMWFLFSVVFLVLFLH